MNYFRDPADFAWTKYLTDNYQAIQQEFDNWPENRKKSSALYGQDKLVEHGNWDMVPLSNRRDPLEIMREYFPVTLSVMPNVPFFENMVFSILRPGVELKPHRGWTTDILRVHLGIHTNPDSALCCMGECVSLRDGEVLIFEDGEEHYAYNSGLTDKVVLLFDVHKNSLK